MVSPVIYEACLEARKTTRSATSVMAPTLFSGTLALASFSSFFSAASKERYSVSAISSTFLCQDPPLIVLGQTVLTRMLSSAKEVAREVLKFTKAVLGAEY